MGGHSNLFQWIFQLLEGFSQVLSFLHLNLSLDDIKKKILFFFTKNIKISIKSNIIVLNLFLFTTFEKNI
jgi:hypothetical protein